MERDIDTQPYNLHQQSREPWLQRAELALDLLVDHFGAVPITVSDLGCGDEKLRAAIGRRDLPFTCIGYDLLPQSPAVHRLDLLSEIPSGRVDAIVILGVFKYLADVQDLLRRLVEHAPVMIVSYLVSDHVAYSADVMAERGWRHHLSSAEFERELTAAGWTLDKSCLTPERRTRIWRVLAPART